MIVLCFPGVGATTLANSDKKYINITSDLFWIEPYVVRSGNYNWDRTRWGNWERVAGNFIEALSVLGYIVLTEINDELIYRLEKTQEQKVIVAPTAELKEEWIARLEQREPSKENNRVLNYLRDHYDDLLDYISKLDIKVIQITSMDYKLADLLEGGKDND